MRLGGLQRLGCLVVAGAGCPALPEQRVLPLEMIAGRGQLSLRRHEIGLRSPQGIELVLRLQSRDDLARLHPVALLEIVFQHPPGNPERQGDLVLGFDPTGENDRHADGTLVRRQCTNGTRVPGRRIDIGLARGKEARGNERKCREPEEVELRPFTGKAVHRHYWAFPRGAVRLIRCMPQLAGLSGFSYPA